MTDTIYNQLQLREVFHIEFLRWLGKKVKPGHYAVKGGTNLRLFFKSVRYSEDMDLDARGAGVHVMSDIVMDILRSRPFLNILQPFGIESVQPPDMTKAKQTLTTQRFKIHLISRAGEELFTKIEFSRRGFSGDVIVQPIPDSVSRAYKMAPLLVPHYTVYSSVDQKVNALASRSVIQARDIFDLYILSSQHDVSETKKTTISQNKFAKALENIFEVGYGQFQDTVMSYLAPEDRAAYQSDSCWDEIKLKVSDFINELRKKRA